MTTQSYEVLEYRDKKYCLIGEPLDQYLKKHKEIEFFAVSTDLWKGYQGFWLLENDQLYLTSFLSNDYTFEEIFKSDKPVLADWFTGTLEFGIGTCYSDDLLDYYENYVWLDIKNGKVHDKKIIKRFYQKMEINFGKYKGRKFEEILYGKITQNTYTTIRNFITCLLEFIINPEFNFKIQCPRFIISQDDKDFTKRIRLYGVGYFLTQNYLALSSQSFYEDSFEDDKASGLSILLEKILSSDFLNIMNLNKPNLDENAEIAENSFLINPDLRYLIWALKNVETFAIPPSELKKEFSIKRLKSLKLKRLSDKIFEYEPDIEIITFKFPEHILQVNQEKFEKIHKVKYDSGNDFFILNLPNEELMFKFGHYLDENFIRQSGNGVYKKYPKNYNESYNSDDWLRDVAGTDDPEVMNDVYWNLD